MSTDPKALEAPAVDTSAEARRIAMWVSHGYRCDTCGAVFLAHDGHSEPLCTRPSWSAATDDEKAAQIEAGIRSLASQPAEPELLAAAKKVLAGLEARIEAAPPEAVPVFDGIVDLHDAIGRAERRQPTEPEGTTATDRDEASRIMQELRDRLSRSKDGAIMEDALGEGIAAALSRRRTAFRARAEKAEAELAALKQPVGDGEVERLATRVDNWPDEANLDELQEDVAAMLRRLSRENEEKGRRLDIESAAISLADMVTEWVEGGERALTDWRIGLRTVIELRLRRIFDRAAAGVSPDPEHFATAKTRLANEALLRALESQEPDRG
jgi:hypothetical protein